MKIVVELNDKEFAYVTKKIIRGGLYQKFIDAKSKRDKRVQNYLNLHKEITLLKKGKIYPEIQKVVRKW